MQSMTEDFSLPDESDKLFKDYNKDYRHNAIVSTGIDKFFLFSEGYKSAALRVFDQLDGEAWSANTCVYPLVFLNRQFLELRLKELICGLNFVIDKEKTFPNGHNLESLWNKFKDLLYSLGEDHINKSTLENAEKLILEFNAIDSNSFSFRYPVDKSHERKPSLTLTNIDLQNFMKTMKKLYNYFDALNDLVSYQVDQAEEYISIMRSEYESEMNSYYNY